MAFDPTLPGMGEATRAWICSQIVANLGLLNTALARDSQTPISAITSTSVNFGDPDKLPPVAISPVFFTVVGGGRLDGMDMDHISQVYIGGIGYNHDIYSSIVAYIHPDALTSATGVAQETARQLLMDRIADWLRGCCFNTNASVAPIIGSREFSVAPAFDQLSMAHIESIEKGTILKSFAGSQTLNYVHCRHRANLVGNS